MRDLAASGVAGFVSGFLRYGLPFAYGAFTIDWIADLPRGHAGPLVMAVWAFSLICVIVAISSLGRWLEKRIEAYASSSTSQ